MKNLISGALRATRNSFASKQTIMYALFTVLLSAFLMSGCKKAALDSTVPEAEQQSSKAVNPEGNVVLQYTGLSGSTIWQLQQARAASAKYLDFDNAIKDGYADINVVTQHMGYHYLKAAHLDLEFDARKPEILVYNKQDDGRMQLLAVEYAVPISLTPNTAPEGFIGSADVWDRNTYFGLWLLHTWVWAYNPSGVFNPTNPLVHVH